MPLSLPLTFFCVLVQTSFGWSSITGRTLTSSVSCKSNTTHIAWPANTITTNGGTNNDCTIQTRSEAEREIHDYLYRNLMPYDIPNASTLGFKDPSLLLPSQSGTSRKEQQTVQKEEEEEVISLPDGLSDSIISLTIQLSLDAKIQYPWTLDIPKDIYLEYVTSFSNLNEGRTNWRPLLAQKLSPTISRLLKLKKVLFVEDVVHAVNSDLWSALGDIKFKSGQTPLVYDPMSVIAFQYGSCTGVSILLVNALRSVGVPARLAGTDAWNGDEENGNHSWVEVYLPSRSGDKWMFLEASPAFGGVPDVNPLPCKNWFCNKAKFDGNTRVYAARLNKVAAGGVIFPLAWDESSDGVPGEDRTAVMTSVCSEC